MTRLLNRLKIFFLGLFFVLSAGTLAYHYFYVWPAKRCESQGNWWDPKTRVCAVPIPISTITGRKPNGEAIRPHVRPDGTTAPPPAASKP
jgi:hypothetical protein